ncbi:DUF4870 domain-containing protein [Schumannella luteola]
MADSNPYAAPVSTAAPLSLAEEKQWAILTHVLSIFFGIITAAVFFFLYRDRGPFIRHHVVTEWNFRLTQLIVGGLIMVVSLVGWAIAFSSAFQPDRSSASASMTTGITIFFIGWVGVLLVQLIGVVYGIIAAIRASNGTRYTIPLAIPFVTP